MGLTIHYQLKLASRSLTKARTVINQLHDLASTLPLGLIGPVMEITGDDCNFQNCTDNEPHRWLLIQANGNFQVGKCFYDVRPQKIFAFTTRPGKGCEPANFGLCLYPSTIEVPGRVIRTGLTGWRWSSFCKTQYASTVSTENFIKCHLLVVRMLDHCKQLGILGDVDDEGDYFQKRDAEALTKEVDEWNENIAAFAGKLKDQIGDALQAPILAHPAFEHLEAKGDAA